MGCGMGAALPWDTADILSICPSHAHQWLLLTPQVYCPVSFYHMSGKSHWGAGIWLLYWKLFEQGELNVCNTV